MWKLLLCAIALSEACGYTCEAKKTPNKKSSTSSHQPQFGRPTPTQMTLYQQIHKYRNWPHITRDIIARTVAEILKSNKMQNKVLKHLLRANHIIEGKFHFMSKRLSLINRRVKALYTASQKAASKV